MGSNRRKSRELVLQVMFGLNFMDVPSSDYREIIDTFEEQFRENDCEIEMKFLDKEYCFKILKGINENKNHIDELIKNNLKGWRIERISKVDLSILRLATYEMCFDKLPTKIAVNEAINLTKKYSLEKSRPYINGVLDSISKEEKLNEA